MEVMADMAFYLVQSDLLNDDEHKLEALHHLWALFLDWHSPHNQYDRFLAYDKAEMQELAAVVFDQIKTSGLLELTTRRCRARLYSLLGTLSWLLPLRTNTIELKPIYRDFCKRDEELYGTDLQDVLPVFREQEMESEIRHVIDGLVTREVMSPDPI